MKLIRFASAPDGGSQFVEVDIPIENASSDAFGNVVHRSEILPAQSTMLTEMPEGLYQDWHPASTPHFAKDGGIWPVHCVQNTPGAEFHKDLSDDPRITVISKGTDESAEGDLDPGN